MGLETRSVHCYVIYLTWKKFCVCWLAESAASDGNHSMCLKAEAGLGSTWGRSFDL